MHKEADMMDNDRANIEVTQVQANTKSQEDCDLHGAKGQSTLAWRILPRS